MEIQIECTVKQLIEVVLLEETRCVINSITYSNALAKKMLLKLPNQDEKINCIISEDESGVIIICTNNHLIKPKKLLSKNF